MTATGKLSRRERQAQRAASTRGSNYLLEVEGLRALAALSVILTHVSFHYPPSANKLLNFITQNTIGPPAPSVMLFFMISGFVMYLPFATARLGGRRPPELVPYAIRRLARIVPAYWVALTIVSIWLGFSYMTHPSALIRYYGFLQIYGNLHTLGGGIGPAWTLDVEITFYIALPLLAWVARWLGRSRSVLTSELMLALGMIAISEIWQLCICTFVHFSTGYQESYLITLPGTLDVFATGMFLAVLSVEARRREHPRPAVSWINRHAGVVWIAAGVIVFIIEQIPESTGPTIWWMSTHALKTLAMGMMLAPLVLGPQQHGPLRRVLAIRPLVFIGTITYGMYLWHFPILTKEAASLVPHGELTTAIVIGFWAIVFGALSFYLVERPAQNFARSLIARRRERARAVVAG